MNKTDKNIKQAIDYCRFQKDRNWRNFQRIKSMLEKCLEDLSKKEEEELTKTDLLGLIQLNCDYMKALNLYNYYKDELSALLIKKQDGNSEAQSNV